MGEEEAAAVVVWSSEYVFFSDVETCIGDCREIKWRREDERLYNRRCKSHIHVSRGKMS